LQYSIERKRERANELRCYWETLHPAASILAFIKRYKDHVKGFCACFFIRVTCPKTNIKPKRKNTKEEETTDPDLQNNLKGNRTFSFICGLDGL